LTSYHHFLAPPPPAPITALCINRHLGRFNCWPRTITS